MLREGFHWQKMEVSGGGVEAVGVEDDRPCGGGGLAGTPQKK